MVPSIEAKMHVFTISFTPDAIQYTPAYKNIDFGIKADRVLTYWVFSEK